MSKRGTRTAARFALLVSVTMLTTALPAAAATSLPPQASPQALAQVWAGAEAELAQASADQQRVAAQPPAAELLLQARQQLQLEEAAFRFRDAARIEQVVVYAMAVDPQVQAAAEPMLPQQQVPTIRYTIDGLRSLWHAAGIQDFSTVHIRHNRDFKESAPIDDLTGFYKASGSRHSIDWSYLASINYVESDFGRVNGPSSAGALGPMQFMPGTWADFGNGADVMSPRDSIEAAARYLKAMGAPANMDRAIYRYNNDADYVASIQGFAAAFRSDPSWLGRVYYWSTWG